MINGTGYTFGIYINSKRITERDNYFSINYGEKIVIIGKKYNYLLTTKKDSFEYDIITYDKDILRLGIDNPHGKVIYEYIYLYDEIIEAFYGGDINNSDKKFLSEIELCKKIIRKKKIIKLNDNMV
jgi:hypothetical protein